MGNDPFDFAQDMVAHPTCYEWNKLKSVSFCLFLVFVSPSVCACPFSVLRVCLYLFFPYLPSWHPFLSRDVFIRNFPLAFDHGPCAYHTCPDTTTSGRISRLNEIMSSWSVTIAYERDHFGANGAIRNERNPIAQEH